MRTEHLEYIWHVVLWVRSSVGEALTMMTWRPEYLEADSKAHPTLGVIVSLGDVSMKKMLFPPIFWSTMLGNWILESHLITGEWFAVINSCSSLTMICFISGFDKKPSSLLITFFDFIPVNSTFRPMIITMHKNMRFWISFFISCRRLALNISKVSIASGWISLSSVDLF